MPLETHSVIYIVSLCARFLPGPAEVEKFKQQQDKTSISHWQIRRGLREKAFIENNFRSQAHLLYVNRGIRVKFGRKISCVDLNA